MTKIVGTLGPKSQSIETLSACLEAGMSGMIMFIACLVLFFYLKSFFMLNLLVGNETFWSINGEVKSCNLINDHHSY